jgi:hypothetical protein
VEKKGVVSVEKDWFHPVSQRVQKAMQMAEKKYISFKVGSTD